MVMDLLSKRAKLLQGEIQKAKQNVSTLTENLEQAKANLHKVSGHLQEVWYLIMEQKKVQDAQAKASKEQEDGEANNESSESTPKE